MVNRLKLVPLCIAILLTASAAQAALPPDIAGEIHTIGAAYRAELSRADIVSTAEHDTASRTEIRSGARERAERQMVDSVVSSIGRRPELAGEIVSEAVAVLPGARDAVVARASETYPRLAAKIREAAGVASSEAPAAAMQTAQAAPSAAGPPLRTRIEETVKRPPLRAIIEPNGSPQLTAPNLSWRERYKVIDTPPTVEPVKPPSPTSASKQAPARPPLEFTEPNVSPVPPPVQTVPVPKQSDNAFKEPAPPIVEPVPDPGTNGAQRAPLFTPGGIGFAAAIPDPQEDPIEGVNRVVFAFNDALDTYVIRPIAWGYGYVMPDPVKAAVRRGFGNLKQPIVFANDVLQGELTDAATTAGRFVVNTTVGLVGLFDVATGIGLPGHPADFGQTMHAYGMEPGPYIVLPILGPTTARDGVGRIVDIFFDPLTYFTDSTTQLAVAAGDGITKRETLIEPLDELKKSSLDYYAAIRSAYYQDRAKTLRRGKEPKGGTLDDAFAALE